MSRPFSRLRRLLGSDEVDANTLRSLLTEPLRRKCGSRRRPAPWNRMSGELKWVQPSMRQRGGVPQKHSDKKNSSVRARTRARQVGREAPSCCSGIVPASDPRKSRGTQEISVLDGRSNRFSNSYGKTRAVISVGQIHLCTCTHKSCVILCTPLIGGGV